MLCGMNLYDFLKNVDFETEYVVINIGRDVIINNECISGDNTEPVKVSFNLIEGFISVFQGESIISFRPEAVTHFSKNKKIKTEYL